MQKMIAVAALLLSAYAIGGCTKDREFDPNDLAHTPLVQTDTLSIVTGPSLSTVLNPGDLVINEFVATGSTYPNELGASSDWVELYNSRSDTLTLYSGYWYITDSIPDPAKYHIPVTVKIPPQGYYVLQCDGNDTAITEVHTNFKLSASGEQLGLFYSADGSGFRTIDQYTFGAQTAGSSFGRLTDGGTVWTTLAPTPGSANHQ